MSNYWKQIESIQNTPSAPKSDDVLVPTNEALVRKIKVGAGWPFWIAGLSVLNAALTHFEAPIRFAVGLVMTDLIYAIGHALNPALAYVAVGLDAMILGFLIFLGVQARRSRIWAFVTAITLLVLDVGVQFWVSAEAESLSIIGIIFHALAIHYLVAGMLAANLHNTRVKEGKA